ncbi:flagellin N-terminal helical domain-containing protein [Agrobacterium tumefaciens]|uniref:Flagellin n=1 Tax=Rhizobium lupini TaxID=136996 RepID=Q9F4K8_RHILU|nr:flagellin [Agrobacterium tumefaciens]AAG14364.1 flagellin A [Bradyrhizobium lupini]ADY63476.1 Flagellin A protein [Agrobacterium tumefaciens]
MASVLTNINAMSALQTLRSISSNMEDTQSRISSGMRVGSASDNAAYWSIATTMRSDNASLSAVQDAIGLGAAKVDTASAGMDAVIDVVKQIKNKLVTAQESSADKTKIQGEVKQLQEQLKGIVDSASFSGENWLKGDLSTTTTKSVVGSFVREGGTVSVKTIDYALNASKVLVDTRATGTKTGILDTAYTGLNANTVTVDINKGGVITQASVRAYSTDEMLSLGAKVDGANSNVAVGGGSAFVKVDGSWVKGSVDAAASITASTPVAGKFAAAYTAAEAGTAAAAGDAIIVDETNSGAGAVNLTQSVLTMDVSSMSSTDVGSYLTGVEKALTSLTSAGAELGSIKQRIDLQVDFASKLGDALAKGIGRLVDADMNEESTKLKALQTQQQLAIQSLSIANSDSQNILSLFR